MTETAPKHTADEKIVITAKTWRRRDLAAIADKRNRDAQRAEYQARKDLRKVIDDAGSEP